jgi:hypothetical protein
MAGTRTLRARAQAPHIEGGRSAEGACERASRDRSRCAGGWINGSRADDNQRIMTSKSFLPKKPVIMQLSADPSDSSFAASVKRITALIFVTAFGIG